MSTYKRKRKNQSARLTKRELEVLHWIVGGRSNKQIADILDLSANTVRVHRANLMNQLGVHNAAELVVYAVRHSLVSVSPSESAGCTEGPELFARPV